MYSCKSYDPSTTRHTETSWFKEQIYSFIFGHAKREKLQLSDIKAFLSKSNCNWTQSNIQKHVERLKNSAEHNPFTDITYDPPVYTKTENDRTCQSRATKIVIDLVQGSTNENIDRIMNHIHKHNTLPNKYKKYPIGECIDTVNEYVKTCNALNSITPSVDAKMKRSILYSAAAVIDDHEKIKNPKILRSICSQRHTEHNFLKIKTMKNNFCNHWNDLLITLDQNEQMHIFPERCLSTPTNFG